MKLKASTEAALEAVTLTTAEKAAVMALLYSGVTNGALDRLGLNDLCERLSAGFNGPWQYDTDKDKVLTLETYRVKAEVNVDVA